jgi:hypothetical protein
MMKLPMDLSDATYLLFLAICLWLSVNIDLGGGGGKRSRVPSAC